MVRVKSVLMPSFTVLNEAAKRQRMCEYSENRLITLMFELFLKSQSPLVRISVGPAILEQTNITRY